MSPPWPLGPGCRRAGDVDRSLSYKEESKKRSTTMCVAALLIAAGAASAQELAAHPGPANNGGSPNWAMFFDLEALTPGVVVSRLTTANAAAANAAFSVEVLVRNGTALGGPVATGPGSSMDGWTSLGTAPATQGATAGGVALRFTGAGPRYFGTGTPPLSVFQDSNLKLTTGDGRSAPFTPTGSFFTSRDLVGALRYSVGPAPCYANCDGSTTEPILNVNDFICFQTKFAAQDPAANCDGSTAEPVLNVNDFICFQTQFAAGCP
jgi:hypothetical protein